MALPAIALAVIAPAVVAGIGDVVLNGGRWIQGLTSRGLEAFGKGQQEAAKKTMLHGFGATFDMIGEALTTFFGDNGFTRWLRNKGQDMMGIPEGQRTFGSATYETRGTSGAAPHIAPAPGTEPDLVAGLENGPAPQVTVTQQVASLSETPNSWAEARTRRDALMTNFSEAHSPEISPNRATFQTAVTGPTTILNTGLKGALSPTLAPVQDMTFDNVG